MWRIVEKVVVRVGGWEVSRTGLWQCLSGRLWLLAVFSLLCVLYVLPGTVLTHTIPSTAAHPISLREILVLFSCLHQGVQCDLLPWNFPNKILLAFPVPPKRACHVHLILLYLINLFSLINFVTHNEEHFRINSAIHSVNRRNGNHLHRPIASRLSYLNKVHTILASKHATFYF
jgi:hypothetical protein